MPDTSREMEMRELVDLGLFLANRIRATHNSLTEQMLSVPSWLMHVDMSATKFLEKWAALQPQPPLGTGEQAETPNRRANQSDAHRAAHVRTAWATGLSVDRGSRLDV